MSSKGGHNKSPELGNPMPYKITDLTNACDCLDNLQICIYDLEATRIIYVNPALEKCFGNDSLELTVKGWTHWLALVHENERSFIDQRMKDLFSRPSFHAPHVLKYHIRNSNNKGFYLRHEILFHNLEDRTLAINYFFNITGKEQIEAYFQNEVQEKGCRKPQKTMAISPREKQVLKLVADGLSSKQIADQLFISNHTAISHRKNLIEKFQVKNTAQLIKRASLSLELW